MRLQKCAYVDASNCGTHLEVSEAKLVSDQISKMLFCLCGSWEGGSFDIVAQ